MGSREVTTKIYFRKGQGYTSGGGEAPGARRKSDEIMRNDEENSREGACQLKANSISKDKGKSATPEIYWRQIKKKNRGSEDRSKKARLGREGEAPLHHGRRGWWVPV